MLKYTTKVDYESYDLFSSLKFKGKNFITIQIINERPTLLPEIQEKECLAQYQGPT